jgi:hypothetical protein
LRFGGNAVPSHASEEDQLCRLGPGGGCVSVAGETPVGARDPRDLDLLSLVLGGSDWLDHLYASPRLVLGIPSSWQAVGAELEIVIELEHPCDAS